MTVILLPCCKFKIGNSRRTPLYTQIGEALNWIFFNAKIWFVTIFWPNKLSENGKNFQFMPNLHKTDKATALKTITLDMPENSTPIWYITKLNFDYFYIEISFFWKETIFAGLEFANRIEIWVEFSGKSIEIVFNTVALARFM